MLSDAHRAARRLAKLQFMRVQYNTVQYSTVQYISVKGTGLVWSRVE